MARTIKELFRFLLKFLLGLVCGIILLLLVFRSISFFREKQNNHAAAPSNGRYISANDIQMFVEESGPQTGHAVIFVHGFGAWSETWQKTTAALSAAGFHCIALDMPPFGFSDRPAANGYSRQAQAKRILAVMDALNIKQATLVGHSYGAGSTMETVFSAPDRFSSLVLVDAALGLDSPPPDENSLSRKITTALLAVKPVRNILISATITNPLFTKTLLSTFLENKAAATTERLAIYKKPFVIKNSTNDVGDWLQNDLLAKPSTTALSATATNYSRLALPILLLWGKQDTTTPLIQGEHLANLIPNSSLISLEGVGHIPQIEDPESFNQNLLQFLQKHN